MAIENLSMLERLTVQMEYAVPLIRDLQKILGEETINKALAERIRMQTEDARITSTVDADMSQLEQAMGLFAADGALDFEIKVSDDSRFEFDVTHCRYTDMMEQMGARDIGHLLICNLDYPMAELQGMKLTRTQTRMQGASHCDFCYQKRKR